MFAQPRYSESPPEPHTRSSAHASCVITRVAVRVSVSPKAVGLRVIDPEKTIVNVVVLTVIGGFAS